MSRDKIRAAARRRMAETGEPYAAARRAVVNEHQGGAQAPFPDTGCVLRMSGEIHGWLAGLRDSSPRAARRVAQALAALLEDGTGPGDPLVASTAGAWPGALAEALGRSCPESLERLAAARRAAAAAVALVQDILFAVEPPATALLIAALEGPEVTESQFPEAVMASADMLRRVRAGQAPEAATHGYDNSRSFLEELYPGNVGDASIMSATSRD